MLKLLCLLFGHRFNHGHNAKMAIYTHCERCKRLVPGGMAVRP